MSRLKELEGKRLYRSLRFLFNKRGYQFHWTNADTSYFDGKDIHVIYDVQRPHLKEFTDAECRIIRQGHAYHEVGHFLYDYLPDYQNWLKDNGTNDKKQWSTDWTTHKKYPKSWLQFFGNFGLDGRMERLLKLSFAVTEVCLDFTNYFWTFQDGYETNLGTSPLQDFRTLYGLRCLGMSEPTNWHPDAAALIDSQQSLLENFRTASNTKDCLTIISEIMENVWPTLLEWFEQEKEEPTDNPNQFSNDMIQGSWGVSAEEIEQNAKAVPGAEGNSKPERPSFTKLIKKNKKALQQDNETVAQEEAEETTHQINGVVASPPLCLLEYLGV